MAKPSNKAIGLLGGSFDPVHKGHLTISKIALKKIKLDQIYWLITKKNPFKNKVYFSLNNRIELAKKATKKFNKIKPQSEVYYFAQKKHNQQKTFEHHCNDD